MDDVYLWLNKLSGSIPTEIGLLDQVNSLRLDFNLSLRGTIPTEIGLLSNLQYLTLEVSCFMDDDDLVPSMFNTDMCKQ